MSRIFLVIPLFLMLHPADFVPMLRVDHHAGVSIHLFPPECDTIPELNRRIIKLVDQQIGKTVDRGECWDLAALVLNETGASWDKEYGFGRLVDPEKDCIYPGDLIQFEGVYIKYTVGLAVYTETMGHHTAVIHDVKSKGVFVLAHQNTGTSGRKVGLSGLDLKTIIKGKYQVYRPVKE
ncbi:MAG: hypothetical protein WCJ26_13225 [bacterium]